MTRRIVRLLEEPKQLTGRQLAQRKYRASAKGRAAHARAREKERLKADFRAKERARLIAWKAAHPDEVRVYNRIYQQRRKREERAS